MTHRGLDCIVIGFNDPPIARFEKFIAQYGKDSEAYRDLQLSFVEVDGQPMNYVDLMNHALSRAGKKADLAAGEIPNLAAVYLTNFMRRQGLEVDWIDLFQKEKDRLRRMLEDDPLAVAITTTFYVINFPVNEMVEFIRQHNEKTRIIIGGPLVANHARNYLGDELDAAFDDLGADIYVHDSQGELTLSRLVHCLKENGDLASVPNLYVRENGSYTATAREFENNCMNSNYIDWQALRDDDLGATLQTRTARSCAFSCAFCNYPTRAGKLSLANLDTIEKELDSMAARGNVRNVVFIDDTFNVPLPRFKDFCRLLIEKDYGFNWFSYFRCSNSDEETIELMAKSGCKGVFLGIESGAPQILLNMSKKATVEKYRRGIEALHQHGITTFGSYILGFPGETRSTVEETLSFVRDTATDYYRIQMWYNEAGTPIHQKREEFGIEGDGFVWEHDSMDSLEAIEHIERAFLSIHESEWMPQWSFDFWAIPYLMGRGVSRAELKRFMGVANQLLRLEVAAVEPREKDQLKHRYQTELVDTVREWNV